MATSLQFIKSASGTDVASLSITGFTSQYNVYAIHIPKLIQNGNNDIRARFVDNSGSVISDSEYDFASMVMNSHSSFSEGQDTSATSIDSLGVNDQNETYGIGNTTYIFNPADSSSYTFLLSQNAGMRDIGKLRSYKLIGVHKVEETITGFNIFGESGGNISATIVLYGVK
tara:strand:+ start:383 stop:895 length:513 start_codon:yes stop_codon:yes gene_type:complete